MLRNVSAGSLQEGAGMDAVRLGPLVFGIDRFAAIVGVAVFLAAVWWLARRQPPEVARRLHDWSWRAVLWGAIAGRLGHVVAHWESFAIEPWRAVAFWQGGFSAQAMLVAVAVVTVLATSGLRGLQRPAVIALALGLVAWQGTAMLRGPLQAPPLPVQSFTAIDGREIRIADREGRPLVINLWATWCAPCRRELPMMAELAAGHPDIDVAFANQREAPQRVGMFLATERLDLGIVILDSDGVLGRHYGALGLPTTVFLDADGRLLEKHVGEMSREAFGAGLARLRAGAARAAGAP